jgi:hypothetical protein
MAQYYKLAQVRDTQDADMFDSSEQDMLTVDMYTVHENVRIVDKKQVDICTMVVGEGTMFDVVASVGQDGSLYLRCEEAEELVL